MKLKKRINVVEEDAALAVRCWTTVMSRGAFVEKRAVKTAGARRV